MVGPAACRGFRRTELVAIELHPSRPLARAGVRGGGPWERGREAALRASDGHLDAHLAPRAAAARARVGALHDDVDRR